MFMSKGFLLKEEKPSKEELIARFKGKMKKPFKKDEKEEKKETDEKKESPKEEKED